MDVQFIFDSVRLGLSSSTNILQIAEVALWVVSEVSAIFVFTTKNNSISSPGLLG